MTLMEKYKEEAIRDANIKAVVNMLLIGADEKKVKEFYQGGIRYVQRNIN